jgi:hypothetical protein
VILGLSPLVFIHTLISLVGIATGVMLMREMWLNHRADALAAWFLGSTILTSASGFILPAAKFMPSHAVGVLSLIVLAACCYARYGTRMHGAWRIGYVLTAVIALYFNVFVLLTQLFLKVPPLHALAPNLNEAPFAITQALVLAGYVAWAVLLSRHYHPREMADEAVKSA